MGKRVDSPREILGPVERKGARRQQGIRVHDLSLGKGWWSKVEAKEL